MTVVFDYLVFNVQFIFAVSQQLIHYIIHFVVCQVFFLSFFEKLFLLDRKPLLKIFIQQLLYYIISLNFCQELFSTFFDFLFSQVVRFWPSATFISYHRFKCLSRTFLSFFWKTFWTSFFRSSVLFLLATFTSYHRWSCLSRTFLFFLKTFLSFCRLRQRQVI